MKRLHAGRQGPASHQRSVPLSRAAVAPRLTAGVAASGLALTAGLAFPRAARGREWEPTGNVGVFVNFHFGGARGGEIGLGLEARLVFIDRTSTCGGTQQLYSGAVARVELVDWRQTRLTLGPVLGATTGLYGYAAEAGGGLVFGRDPGLIAQVGGELEGALLLNTRVAYTIGRDGQVGGGVRFPPLSISGFCVVGRPLRRGGNVAAPAAATVACSVGRHHEADRQAAAGLWLHRARLEWASVPSFCELAEQLAASDAPAALVDRARQAAADELRHAIVSAQLAAGMCGAPALTLEPSAPDHRPVARGRDGLSRLAVESWTDGCVGEAAAAALALREARACANRTVTRAQNMIAVDEARHAELAWDVLEWTMAVDRDGVRRALNTATPAGATATNNNRRNDASDQPTSASSLKRFGILDADQAVAERDTCQARAQTRLAARLRA